jgi:DegV family protein with EDD domain
MTVRIVTDSTCDLPAHLVAEHAITVVPLTVFFGEQGFRDGVDMTGGEFYARLAAAPDLPRTSQPSAEQFIETYTRLAAESEAIVSIHISAKLSGTLNSATVARDAVRDRIPVELLDSENVSLGLGAIVLVAARAAQREASADEVVAVAKSAMGRIGVYAVLDTLEFLRRGGRIGRARSLLGSLLNIKPVIAVQEGEVVPFDRVRTRGRAIERLVAVATEDPDPELVFVGSAGPDPAADALLARLRPLLPNAELLRGEFGPVVGAHAGPGMLGVCPLRRA